MEVIAARSMNLLYIWIDIAFLLIFSGVLVYTKRYQALIAGLLGGILYFAVDTVFFICCWEPERLWGLILRCFFFGFP